MKLIQKLVVATTGFALLFSTLNAKPVNALGFSLSGTFDGILEAASPEVESLETFDGTYFLSEFPTDTPVDLTSWDINLRNATGDIVFNFNNEVPSSSAFITPFSQLRFQEGLEEFVLNFPIGFNGSGTTDSLGLIFNLPPDTFGFVSGRLIESATSQPIPEPATTSMIAVAGCVVLLLRRKVAQ